MLIYVEEINLSFIIKLVNFFFTKNYKNRFKLIYFKSFFFSKNIIYFLSKIFNFEIEKFNFEINNYRDENNECINSKFYRKIMYNFQKDIKSSSFYINNISNIQNQFLKKSIIKSISTGHFIMDHDLPAYSLFLIYKVYIHSLTVKDKFSDCVFFYNSRPWFQIYQKHALELGFKLIKVRIPFEISKFKYRCFSNYILYNFPFIILFINSINFLKNLINFNLFKNKSIIKKPIIYSYPSTSLNLLNLTKNEYLSDYFFSIYSSLPTNLIGYTSNNNKVSQTMLKNGFVNLKFNSSNKKINKPLNYIFLESKNNILESKQLNFNLIRYEIQKSRWINFFKKNNVKVFLTWFKFYYDHIVISDAINHLGGISAIWQRSFEGYPSIDYMSVCDLMFTNSFIYSNHDKLNKSKIRYKICVGLLSDYNRQYLEKKANVIKNNLKNNGAKYIVSLFDQNSNETYDHEKQRESYHFLLEELNKNSELGVILKPKKIKSLERRLGKDTIELIKKSINTGRCYLFQSTGEIKSSVPINLAAYASDLCICSNLNTGTSSIECASTGKPTVVLDREGFPFSDLYKLKNEEVIFNSWDDLIINMNKYFKNNMQNHKFGNWSKILKDIDPYQDGLGAQRMGNYLLNLINNYSKKMPKEDSIEEANYNFCQKWGKDKIDLQD